MRVASVIHSTFLDAVHRHRLAYTNEGRASKLATKTRVANFTDWSIIETNFDFKDNDKDNYTNEVPDPALTHYAVANEMEYFNDKAWVFLSAEEARRRYPKGRILRGNGWCTIRMTPNTPRYADGMWLQK